jgi:hypothetical protein
VGQVAAAVLWRHGDLRSLLSIAPVAPIKMDGILYHGTSLANVASIRHDGLREDRPGRGIYAVEEPVDCLVVGAVLTLKQWPPTGLRIVAFRPPAVVVIERDPFNPGIWFILRTPHVQNASSRSSDPAMARWSGTSFAPPSLTSSRVMMAAGVALVSDCRVASKWVAGTW